MGRLLFIATVLLFSISWSEFIPKEKGLYAFFQVTSGEFVIKLHEKETPVAVANFVELAQGKRPFFDINKAKFVTQAFFDRLKFYDAVKDSYIASGCQENTGSMSVGVGYSFVDECYRKGDEINGFIFSEYEAAVVWSSLLYPYFSSHRGNGPSKILNELCGNILKKGTYSPLYNIDISVVRRELGGNKKKTYKRELIFPVVYGSVCMFNNGAANNNGSRFLIVTAPVGISTLNGKATVFGRVVNGMDTVNTMVDSVVSNKKNNISPQKNPEIISIHIIKSE